MEASSFRSGTIGAINVTGIVTSGTTISNSLQFAAVTFPTAQFAYGTSSPAVRVTIPTLAPTAPVTPGSIAVTPTNTFFCIGRPT